MSLNLVESGKDLPKTFTPGETQDNATKAVVALLMHASAFLTR